MQVVALRRRRQAPVSAGGGGGAGGGPQTFRYWRWRITEASTAGDLVSTISEIQVSTGADIAAPSGGTASASVEAFGSAAASAFDGNEATWWGTNVSANGGTQFIQYDFGEGNEVWINAYTFKARSGGEATQAPLGWVMEYSSDGSSWTAADTVTGESTFSSGETRMYGTDAAQPGAAAGGDATFLHWRVRFTETGNFNGGVLGHLVLRETVDGAQAATGGTASSGSALNGTNTADKAFVAGNADGNVWIGAVGAIAAGTSWVAYEFASPVWINAYTMQTRDPSDGAQMARGWVLEYSSDGVSWTAADTRTTQPAWVNNETRSFLNYAERPAA
jgi:hypothetical protein